jgi:hypothetical protein
MHAVVSYGRLGSKNATEQSLGVCIRRRATQNDDSGEKQSNLFHQTSPVEFKIFRRLPIEKQPLGEASD